MAYATTLYLRELQGEIDSFDSSDLGWASTEIVNGVVAEEELNEFPYPTLEELAGFIAPDGKPPAGSKDDLVEWIVAQTDSSKVGNRAFDLVSVAAQGDVIELQQR